MFPGQFTYEVPFILDSRQITDEHRRIILDAVCNSRSKRIVITHGTYTIADTAAFLWKNRAKIRGRIIVLVGSTKMPSEEKTDAHFALGSAYGVASSAKPGIYVIIGCVPKKVTPSLFSSARKSRAQKRH